ncbi:MAG TPA: hypothetical protein VLI06_04760 [Solimonas sp.]|nr:hypothetical protein [Solimonas sp.]
MRKLLAAALLTLSTLALAQAARAPALDAYLAALTAVEQAPAPVSLEPLFAAAGAAQDALMEIQGQGDQAWIETLAEADFVALKAQLRGLQLSRGYDVYAQPDGKFLLGLAQGHGRPDDIAFFLLYRDLWDANLLPRYLEVGNNPTPCVRFDQNVLQPMYAGWRDYAKRHPQAYTGFTRQMLEDLEEAVGLGVCACGNVQSVERELRGFVKRFPDTPVAPKIRSRLKELKEDPDLRPVRCR